MSGLSAAELPAKRQDQPSRARIAVVAQRVHVFSDDERAASREGVLPRQEAPVKFRAHPRAAPDGTFSLFANGTRLFAPVPTAVKRRLIVNHRQPDRTLFTLGELHERSWWRELGSPTSISCAGGQAASSPRPDPTAAATNSRSKLASPVLPHANDRGHAGGDKQTRAEGPFAHS